MTPVSRASPRNPGRRSSPYQQDLRYGQQPYEGQWPPQPFPPGQWLPYSQP
jgi:hypothetical protein